MDKNTVRENCGRIDWDYQPGDKVLVIKDGILCKSESPYDSETWTITSVHTNGTIRIQSATKSERLNIRRVTPYFEYNKAECMHNPYLSITTLTLHHCKPSFFSTWGHYFSLQEVLHFRLPWHLSLHSWGWVTWAKVALRIPNPKQALNGPKGKHS